MRIVQIKPKENTMLSKKFLQFTVLIVLAFAVGRLILEIHEKISTDWEKDSYFFGSAGGHLSGRIAIVGDQTYVSWTTDYSETGLANKCTVKELENQEPEGQISFETQLNEDGNVIVEVNCNWGEYTESMRLSYPDPDAAYEIK
jgi:hypothetical protein